MTYSYGFHSRSRGLPSMNQSSFHEWNKFDMCEITHSHVWRDSFIRGTWHIHVCTKASRHWLHYIHMCDMTHSYLRHDSSIWDMTRLYETWLIYMRHDSFIWLSLALYRAVFRFICMHIHVYICIYVYTCTQIAQKCNVYGHTCKYVYTCIFTVCCIVRQWDFSTRCAPPRMRPCLYCSVLQ